MEQPYHCLFMVLFIVLYLCVCTQLPEGVSSLDGAAISLFIHAAIYSSVFMCLHTSVWVWLHFFWGAECAFYRLIGLAHS